MAIILLSLVGCGFQLRGWNLESGVESIHLDSQPRIQLAVPLRRSLRQAGLRIEPRAADAELTVKILDERRERRTVAVTGGARAAEYEIMLGIRYEIRAGGRAMRVLCQSPGSIGVCRREVPASGQVLREPQWLDARRVFAVDRDNIAGTAGEQTLIEAELTNDLVRQVIRALNAVAASARSRTMLDTVSDDVD